MSFLFQFILNIFDNFYLHDSFRKFFRFIRLFLKGQSPKLLKHIKTKVTKNRKFQIIILIDLLSQIITNLVRKFVHKLVCGKNFVAGSKKQLKSQKRKYYKKTKRLIYAFTISLLWHGLRNKRMNKGTSVHNCMELCFMRRFKSESLCSFFMFFISRLLFPKIHFLNWTNAVFLTPQYL